VEAGLEPLGGSASAVKGKHERVLGPRIPLEQMLAAVWAAMVVYGPRLTAAQYIDWRRVELAKDGFDPEPPPSLTPLYQWFGRWNDVRIAAMKSMANGEGAS
jgi:hypothetical protein